MCHVGQTLPLKNMNTIEKPGTCSTSEELLPPQERWFRAQGHCSKEKKKFEKTPAVSRRNWGRGWDDREQIQNYSIIGWAGRSRKTSRLPAKSWKHQKQMVGSIQEVLTTAWQVYQNDTIFLRSGSRLSEYSSSHLSPWPYYEAISDCFSAVCERGQGSIRPWHRLASQLAASRYHSTREENRRHLKLLSLLPPLLCQDEWM